MTANFFRAILVAAFLVEAGGIAIYIAFRNQLPPELLFQKEQILHSQRSTALVMLAPLCLYLLASPIALIGLYFFKRFARLLYVAVVILGFELEALTGPEIEPRIIALSIEISYFTCGFILALIFWSPIADRFCKMSVTASRTSSLEENP
jgi:hypothetical protein